MPFFLKILSSPERERDGEKIALTEGNTILGRKNPPAKIALEGSKVSRHHCTLVMRGNDLRIDDAKSANGVFVNGKRVDTAMLKEKDRLVIGEFILEVTVK